MWKKAIFLFLFSLSAEESVYFFSGRHFVASYLDCNEEALRDVAHLQEVMDLAVAASNATVLGRNVHVFDGDGFTALYLLSESHASIHTYPEFKACFVDLFTCGNRCSAEKFHNELCAYLKPNEVSGRFFLRNESIEEIAFP